MAIYLDELDQLIHSKHLLKHEFYQAWSRGELSHSCLLEYAKEYYQHVKAFPTYLSALHAHTEEASTRRILLQNLIEEEAGSPNHPELWQRFAVALGATEEELLEHQPNREVTALIATFKEICAERSVAEGLAALYAYESQIPTICHSKIDGLQKHYGMRDPQAWSYFQVHISADEAHAAEERKLLHKYVQSHNFAKVRAAADSVLEALRSFLTGLCQRHQIACT